MMKQMKTANMVSSNSNWNHLLILYTVVVFLPSGRQSVCLCARVREAPSSNMPWSQCSRRNLKFGLIYLQNPSCLFLFCLLG